MNSTSLNSHELARVASAFDESFHAARVLFGEETEWKGRRGGYFCLGHLSFPLLVVAMGFIPVEKTEKYIRLSQEKPMRLGQHLIYDHWTSWESRNPEAQQYGGAIRLPYLARTFSFPGFPELGDEAVALAAAWLFYGKREAVGISRVAERRHSNEYILRLLTHLSFKV